MKKKKFLLPIIYALVLGVIVFLAFNSFNTSTLEQKQISASELSQKIENGELAYVLLKNGTDVYCVSKENVNNIDLSAETDKLDKQVMSKYEFFCSIASPDEFSAMLETARKNADESLSLPNYNTIWVEAPWYMSLIPYAFLLLICGVFFFFMFSQASGNGKAMNFGRSTAKMFDDSKKKVTFKDVAGADEEKEELAEIVTFLKTPDKFTKMGARIPKGVLLVGPPGTGKTLLAKSVAGEAGVPFFSITGSDFVELYVGIGAARVRDLFAQAKKNAPCIIFIDEIDAVGRRRGSGIGGGHDEREQTLNQLLVEMDGFVGNDGIIVMAATNRADILDPALLRSGRFDRQIHVLPPDTKGREEIFKIHARNKKFAEDVSPREVALLTSGFVGADIENLCNEAALIAVRRGKELIEMQDIKDSITRVILGPEKRSHKTSDKTKRLVAYHEAGHAIVARALENCDPVTEVSIIPRGGAGGYTLTRPDEQDDGPVSRASILDRIAMCLGGRAAEKLVIGDISTGASSDIMHATSLAKSFVTKYGMYDDIGPIYLGHGDNDEVFLGRDFSTQKAFSEAVTSRVDDAIHSIVNSADKQAYDILAKKEEILHNLAEVLLDMEKITGAQFEEIYNGKKLADFKQAEIKEEITEEADEKAEYKEESVNE